jgi:hypothetical protein
MSPPATLSVPEWRWWRIRYSRADRREDDMPSVTIHDRTSTGDPTGTITLPGLPDRITLRELIRTRVREEVARYNLRPWGIFQGFIQEIGLPEREPIDWVTRADAAIDLFLANGFIVLVNGAQVVDLETRLDLRGDLDVRFIRLTALGGA